MLRRLAALRRLRLGKHSIPPRECMPIPVRVMELPDPYLYSQFWLMNLGLPVTWDNPDVRLYRGGVEAPTYSLLPSTQYQVAIAVHNGSATKAAPGTGVRIHWIEFGIGGGVAARHLIDEQRVDVPARGQPGEPASVDTQWTTPAQPGHYCIEVELSHPADGNPGNNRAWNNTVVRDAPAGAATTLAIPVFNAFPAAGYKDARFREEVSRVHLTLDSYDLEIPDRWTAADVDAAFTPVEAVWGASLDRTTLDLAPGTGPAMVTLSVAVPETAAPGTQRVFNVGGYVGGRPVGGVTAAIVVKGS